jgi:hypothetical protein
MSGNRIDLLLHSGRIAELRQAHCTAGVWTSRAFVVAFLATMWPAALGAQQDAPRLRTPAFDTQQLGAIELLTELAPGVRDPALAFLAGLLRSDVLDTLAGADIRQAASRRDESTLIPLRLLDRMGRGSAGKEGERVVTFWLTRDGKVAAPYSLLGYHPGSVLIAQRVVLHEWKVGRVVITERGKGSFVLDECYLWAVEEGAVAIDIDGFVDNLLGGAVDDMRVTTLAFFSLDAVRYAMAMGYNAQEQGRSGALNLAKNELEFPSSWKLKSAGKLLRRKAEGLRAAGEATAGS